MRLFVGASIDESFSHSLHEELIPVRIDKSWRDVEFINWHITTCFIGDYQGEIEVICDKIQNVCNDIKAFDLKFNKITTVSHNQPKMIWCKGQRQEPFTDLCTKLNRSILNKKPDHKPTPHITVARSKKSVPQVIHQLDFAQTLEVKEIHLWKSFLNKKKGVNYKVLETFSLKG